MATKLEYEKFYKKYASSASSKKPFHIDTNFLTPTMGEMMEEDLAYEALKGSSDLIDSNANPSKVAFYTHDPVIDTLGYDEDLDAMLVEATLKINEYYNKKSSEEYIDTSWIWNMYDGDTLNFPAHQVNAGENLIVKGQKYDNFQDYFSKKPDVESSYGEINNDINLGVRYVGINTGEIPHFETMSINKNHINNKIVKKKYSEVKDNPKYHYLKYHIDKSDVSSKADETMNYLEDRANNEDMLFYIDKSGNGYEVLNNVDKNTLVVGKQHKTINDDNFGSYAIPNNYKAFYDEETQIFNEEVYDNTLTFLVVAKDDSVRETALDGYRAQEALRKAIGSVKKFRLVLDCGTLTVANKIKNTNHAIMNLFYTDEFIENMINELKINVSDLRTSGLSYAAYGSDIYGRFLAEAYIQDPNTGKWINTNKYVLANTKHTVAIPDYTGKPELNGKKLSDAFQIWTYDFDNVRWLDAFEELGENSYVRRIELHKQISGMDFCNIRNNSVLIGDTLMLIPPTNIKSVVHTTHERIPLLRSKGTLSKGGNHNESLIELTLFFAGEAGINGIPYQHTFPSGETCTYYMNGLRSLIAQFKLTPFLPIESEYINDVLGIEAVSLLNLQTEIVPEYPHLLKVVLTLREFNYRLFMPDLPLGIEQDISQPSLAEMNPIFAKSFQWEVFRYNYQRLLMAGETIIQSAYNTAPYNEYLYRMCTSLQPVKFCSNGMSIYIPDIDWLDTALQIKKEEDDSGVSFIPPELTDHTRDMAKIAAGNIDKIKTISEDIKSIVEKTIVPRVDDIKVGRIRTPYIGKGMDKSYLYINMDKLDDGTVIKEQFLVNYHDPIYTSMNNNILTSGFLNNIVAEEEKTDTHVTWKFKIKMPMFSEGLSTEEYSALKEFIANQMSMDKSLVFQDDSLLYQVAFSYKDGVCTDIKIADNNIRLFEVLQQIGDRETTTTDQDAMLDEDHNFRDPVKMKFVPYIENVHVTDLSITMANTFTETTLKSVDGISAQYVGGQDLSIQVKLLTCDELIVSALNTLPNIAFEYVNKYRRILTCSPIRIKNELIQMMGINEVLIDMIQIDTLEEFPGAYEITIKMSSVDRTIRQRESLRKMEFSTNGGFVGKSTGGQVANRSYFEIDSVLSGVELYPDLELPSIADLKARGYAYIKYTLSNEKRAYPDPDFYLVYTYGYTAAKLKVLMDKYFKDLTNASKEDIQHLELYDSELGTTMIAKMDEAVGLKLVGQCKLSDAIDDKITSITQTMKNKADKNWNNKHKSAKHKDTEAALKYLLACDTTDGWEIKPSWSAPLCDPNTNDLIKQMPKAGTSNEKINPLASSIKVTRRKMIETIDAVLAEPIESTYSAFVIGHEQKSQEDAIWLGIDTAINLIFGYSAEFGTKSWNRPGTPLIKLLNPMYDSVSNTTILNDYTHPAILAHLRAFMYSGACISSASKDYVNNMGPDMFFSKGWGPRMYYSVADGSWFDKNARIVLCRTEDGSNAIPAIPKNVNKQLDDLSKHEIEKYALEDAIARGTVFGAFGIKKYSLQEIQELTSPGLNIKYVSEDQYPLYKEGVKAGFLDPYYNKFDDDSDEIKKYKKQLLIDPNFTAQAYLRNVLVWLRKLILDGLFVSDVDSLAKDVLDLFGEGKLPSKKEVEKQMKDLNDGFFKAGASDIFGYVQNAFSKKNHVIKNDDLIQEEVQEENEDDSKEDNKDKTDKKDFSDLYLMYVSLGDTLPKSFCMRLLYPILMASTDGNPKLYNEMMNRNYTGLESLVSAAISTTNGDRMTADVRTFFNALSGLKMIELTDLQTTWTDDSQKMINSMMQEAYITASKDARAYVMHSYYDMLMNDKRGRLVRAFPAYYMVLIDEGRKVGHWKLHDNFYNMSSIAEIQVVKSRKNPADTCSVVMTNSYNSYADEHDNSTKYQYADLYGIKDVFNNIFSPSSYYQKADDLRNKAELKDTVVLKPGTRMHVRMGYTADAGRMPTVFNGRIAELNVGEVVEIVGQGDGIELVNPLNALGNIEANQIDVAEGWLPNFFTDKRASLSSGGYSPKNLLASILTAEHGGIAKKALNYLSNDRFFNTNPFGILHFGDNHFTNIFENGEVVQNLYEITDDNILPGMNVIDPEPIKEKTTPIINCSLYDKTFWDLMHIAARAGDDYISGIRDFGLRSTIFLGKPNYYYAFAYKEQNGNIYEKRKPFQQYHYIDSYGDIIYNAIKASERDVKTNAVGLWQATSKIAGRKTKTVGPVYLDANIYPEYQKSMTYDTGLLADGNAGIDIPLFTSIGEGRVMAGKFGQDKKEYDDKVNIRLAEIMTINALKDTVKDMYQGDIGIIGNPAIKPHDRISLYDIYEDMQGDFEVETVVHTLNSRTGFTTSIHPDLIVRQKDNVQEIAASKTIKDLNLTCGMTMTAGYHAMHKLSQVDSKLLTALIKSSPSMQVSSFVSNTASNILTSTKTQEALSKLNPNIDDALRKAGIDITEAALSNNMNVLTKVLDEIDDLLKVQPFDSTSILNVMKEMSKLNIDQIEKDIDNVIKHGIDNNGFPDEDAKKLKEKFTDIKDSYTKLFDKETGLDFKPLLDEISVKYPSVYTEIDDKLIESITENNGRLTDRKQLKTLYDNLADDKVIGVFKDDSISKLFKESTDELITFGTKKLIGEVTEEVAEAGLKGLLKKASTVIASLATKAKFGWIGFLVETVGSILIGEFIGLNTKALFASWFDNLQVLTVYPIKQYNRSYTAGMSGQKCAVYGSYTSDGMNSIQGMVMEAADTVSNYGGVLGWIFKNLANDLLLDSNAFRKSAEQYKANLGLIEEPIMTNDEMIHKAYGLVSKQFSDHGNNTHAIKLRARIQSFDLDNDNVSVAYNKYAIRNLKQSEIATNPAISNLVSIGAYPDLQSYITEGRLVLAHNYISNEENKKAESIWINQNNKNLQVKGLQRSDILNDNMIAWDLPILQADANFVLKTILDENYKLPDENAADNKFEVHSATVINQQSWSSTGYRFIIKPKYKNVMPKVFKNVNKILNTSDKKVYHSMELSKYPGYYRVTVYPESVQ